MLKNFIHQPNELLDTVSVFGTIIGVQDEMIAKSTFTWLINPFPCHFPANVQVAHWRSSAQTPSTKCDSKAERAAS